MSARIVVDKNTPLIVEAFSTVGDVTAIDTSEFSPERVRDADAIIVRSEVKVGAHLLEGSHVRFVGTTTIGTDHLDESWLQAHGIAYANAPGCNANSVCEYVLAALLVHSTRSGKAIAESTIGIVGVGNVGSRVHAMARAMGMEVILNDPPLARSTGDSKYCPLEEVLSADIVTLHVPLTRSGADATVHLIDERRLASLHRDALLINTSRGAVVDNAALRGALEKKWISGAVLDVWEGEPALDCGLLDLVEIGTPHIAGYSLDGKTNAVRMVYESFCVWTKGRTAWTLDDRMLPPAELPEITLPPGWKLSDRSLEELVRNCYDIRRDDRALRTACSSHPKDLRAQFQKLRTGYRVRREFAATVVRGASWEAEVVLRSLGFAVDSKSKQ